MTRSLSVKMVLIMILLAISLMLIVGTMLVVNVQSFYNEDFLKVMRNFFTVDMRAELNVRSAMDVYRPPARGEGALYDTLRLNAVQLGINTYREFYIFDAQGRYVGGSNDALAQSLDETANLMTARTQRVDGDRLNIAMRYMDYAVPLDNHVVYIRDNKEQVRDLIWQIVLIIIETMFFTLVVAALLSLLLAKTITSPIERLIQGTVSMTGGDFVPIEAASSDEIGTLTDTFNDMAHTLRKTLDHSETERSKYQTIFLYLTDGVLVFDGQGLLTDVNRTARNMLGAQLREQESHIEEVFPQELVAESLQGVRTGSVQTIAQELAMNDKVFSANFASFLLPEQGSDGWAEGLIAVIHDVTEQQKLETARREFIANVSHELRTPLTNIKSYTETVWENPDLPDENRIAFLQVVLSESDRMTRIVKDLLTLSRLDNDKMDLHPAPFDAGAMIKRVCDVMQSDAQSRSHTLTADIADPGEVIGDEERLEQVLVNVLSNSVKYTSDGGEISVEARREGAHVLVRVADNGIGIPEEDLGRIFERFYRVDKARSRDLGGTGLGLAIAQEIMRAHGGDIRIESNYGFGTTVDIHIPVGPVDR